MTTLPREVLKWLQSLDLSWKIKNPKWDLSNGYLIAEIFSWYFPHDIQMHSYYNRDSLELKRRNWFLLKNFILKNQLDLMMEDIEGTIHCREGAASQLIENMYEILTNRKVKKIPPEIEVDYTDYAYQQQLPMHARSTASKAIKNNLRLTEIIADQNIIASANKTQKIINDHIEHRRQQRMDDPKRFGIKLSIGDRCVRQPNHQIKALSETSHMTSATDMYSELDGDHESESQSPITREPSVHFKEVEVKQMDKSALYHMPLHGY
ncbi:spermatogenesis-associated protein 4-like isoform X2 [Physella acuta]|uniref:spermatogenesis-associated protein 4-like isoform X2 n=1 Tax=Physella acuta TaxID=109671 RepID=UPI0027DAC77A|nr:spermatogenesis-associated protein 4-like isoform X2 [Physella acuta]